MNRRAFLASCTAAGGAALLTRPATAAPGKEGPFADAPLRMSFPFFWLSEGSTEEKLERIAAWGFPAYEWLTPRGNLDAIRATMDGLGLEISCIIGAGAIAPGQMVDPDDHDRVLRQFEQSVVAAKKLGCKTLIGLTGNERNDISRDQQTEYVVQCLERLAPVAEREGVTLVMEALNTLVDHRGYFLSRTDHTMEILEAVDSPNVKMCFDIYHQQITEGNIIRNITEHIDRIGHFHVGDNPGRQEPGTGELNYRNIFRAIYETGYKGVVALECGHSASIEDALQRLREYLTWA